MTVYELVSEYWWVLIVSVTALAVALKYAYERLPRGLALRLKVRRKIASFQRGADDVWLLTVTLADGRRYANVRITPDFRFEDAGQVPFKLGDIVDVTRDSRRLEDSAEPVRRIK